MRNKEFYLSPNWLPAIHERVAVVQGALGLQRLQLDGGRAHDGVAAEEAALGHHLHLGALALEGPRVRLVLGVDGHQALVVVLGVVGVLDHGGLVGEGLLLRVGELESGGKKNQ